MLFTYFFLIILCVVLAIKKDIFFSTRYNPVLILLAVNILYTITGYFKSINNYEFHNYVEDFMLVQIIGVLGIIFSLFIKLPIIRVKNSIKINNGLYNSLPNFITGNFVLCVIFILLIIFIFYSHGGLETILSQGYSLITNRNHHFNDSLLFDDLLLIYLFPSLLLTLGYIQNFNKLWIFLSLLFILILILLGTRNPILMYLGSALILYSYRRNSRINYIYLLIILLFSIPFFLFVAYARNIGFSEFINNFELYISSDVFKPLFSGGEFSTTINVFVIHMNQPDWWNGFPGESYFNAFLSLIPRILWIDRPDAISNFFSYNFAPPGEGIGFSVNLEAFINFGYFGVFLINFLISSFWLYIYLLANLFNNFINHYLYSLIFFTAFNINRIDFQTVFKMDLLQFLFGFFAWLLLRNLLKYHIKFSDFIK